MRSINNIFGKVVSKLYRATHIDIPNPIEVRGGNCLTKQNAIKTIFDPHGN
jgi:hypothetical protein